MKKDQLIDMIGEAPDKYVKDAGKKSRRIRWAGWAAGIAAVLAVALLVTQLPSIPLAVSAETVSEAPASRAMERPEDSRDSAQLREWFSQLEARRETVKAARPGIADFSAQASEAALTAGDGNRIWSPINAYIALAMTAELTAGETQEQILSSLGVSDTAELRRRVSAVWEDLRTDDGREICVLANSLWLDQDAEFVQETMDSIAHHYYASVFRGDLGSEAINRAMTNWMRNQTGGLLRDRTGKISLKPEDQVLTAASTVYFQSKWVDEFRAADNTRGVFHAEGGDTEAVYMNKEKFPMSYHWGEDYGAVQMWLENGSAMWFILPDEGKTPADVLARGEYMKMLSPDPAADWEEEGENSRGVKVNLSVPQFDVSSGTDLKPALQAAGVTKIFEKEGNDFSPSILRANKNNDPVYLDSIHQDTRVKIDEKGVTAASYIELEFGAGAAAPPEEIIDFVLDRPFVFAVTKDQIPLFIGTVVQP